MKKIEARKTTAEEIARYISSPPCWLKGFGGLNGLVICHFRSPDNPVIIGGWPEKAIAEALRRTFNPETGDAENARNILIELTKCSHHIDQAILVMRELAEYRKETREIKCSLPRKEKHEGKTGT